MRLNDRKLTLVDALMLIAATAVGIALMRAFGLESGYGLFSAEASPFWSNRLRFRSLVAEVSPLFGAWALTLVVLRFRRPRPRLRRLLRQPGVLAGVTVLIVSSFCLTSYIVGELMVGNIFERSGVVEWFRIAFRASIPMNGCAVVAIWSNLTLSRRWLAEPSWIDRSGRAVGAYWITAAALDLARPLLE